MRRVQTVSVLRKKRGRGGWPKACSGFGEGEPMSTRSVEAQPSWDRDACGEPTGGEAALRDHQEWCLGDAAANRRLREQVARQEGGFNPDRLVAAAERHRLARDEAIPRDD